MPDNRPHLEYYLPVSYKKGYRHRAELLLPVRPLDQFDQAGKGKKQDLKRLEKPPGVPSSYIHLLL